MAPSVFDPAPEWLIIKIANVSRLALVTVTYNKQLDVAQTYINVSYEQNSLEPPIEYNWTLV